MTMTLAIYSRNKITLMKYIRAKSFLILTDGNYMSLSTVTGGVYSLQL